MIYVFLADGCEEIEALTAVDVLRRAKQEVRTVSVGDKRVTGSHGIVIEADCQIADVKGEDAQLLILPGGMPGTDHLQQHKDVISMVQRANADQRYIAAICAAPKILGGLGLLQGRRATSFPSFEGHLTGATVVQDKVVVDGHIITSRGIGTAMDFSLALVALLCGQPAAQKLADDMQYQWS